MTVEKFLSFWTQHNTRIIEVLIALILLLTIYIAFRALFGKKESEVEATFDPSQLEKTLQKILETQGQGGTSAPKSAAAEALGASLDFSEGSEGDAKLAAELESYKKIVAEKNAEIESLKAKLAEAGTAAAASAAASGATASAPAAEVNALSAKEREDLESKIKDLEARLSEYEIIAEDIADLSMYKEENEKLKSEVDKLKAENEKLAAQGGGSGGGGGIPLDPALDIPSDVAALMEQPSTTSEEEESKPEVPAASSAVETPAAEAPMAASSEAAPEPGLISDDLMKEFEAAVSQQKAETGAPEKPANSDEMLNEFEKFVKKG